MKKNVFDKKSIVTKLTLIMFVVICLQSTFLMGSVLLSGVITNISDNTYVSFSEKISNRKNYLESEMNSRWSSIMGYSAKISLLYDDFVHLNDIISDDSKNAFLEQTTSALTSMLRTTMATGTFLILADSTDNGPFSGLYFKDYDPVMNDDANTDLYMLNGPAEISRKLKIPLDRSWNYGISLNNDNRNIFYKPYEAALQSLKENNENYSMGYWYASQNFAGNEMPLITYSIPLTDKNNNVFAILGVEIDQNYLYKMLPARELSVQRPYGYIIALHNQYTDQYTPFVTNTSLQSTLLPKNTPINLETINEKRKIYRINENHLLASIVTHPEPLVVYNKNTPFADEQWVLMGLIDETILMRFTNSLATSLLFNYVFSILVGIIVVYFIGYNFAKPIVQLARKVKENNPETVVYLGRTGLSEIDELSIAVECLNQDVLDSVTKTDKIISMVNIPIGAFECRNDSNVMTVSDSVIKLLNMDTQKLESTMLLEDFSHYLEEIKKNVEDADNHIYSLNTSPPRWVKIESVSNEYGMLGVVMDVTKDIVEKHIIQFERDYDVLTQIYNRSAFKREASKIFETQSLGVTAFVMFDLDNLKYINDTYGHDIGDIYIKTAGKLIGEFPSGNVIVGRMSGDEFYSLFFGFSTQVQIRELMNELYSKFDTNTVLLPNGNEFKVRISSGISWYGKDSSNLEELIRFADFAMYEGKHTVKGEIHEFDKQVYEAESFMLSGKEELNKILDNQLIDFAFQPIIHARTGEIYGYESLMRPQSEVLNSPLKLIQIATAQSQLWKIEKITIYKTLATYYRYKDLFQDKKVFINSVPNELLKDSECAELQRMYGHILKNVVVEIIENEKLNDNIFKRKQELIKSWGALIALDDYGSGYNSDISLLSMSPQIVKIDRVMIDGIEKDNNRQAIIHKLITYAKERNIIVLAEGVETKKQMEFLISMGVELLQGYYIARPNFVPNFDNTIISKEIIEYINGTSD